MWKLMQTGFVLALIAGCASAPSLVPVSSTPERVQFNSFSVVPPSSAGWMRQGREEQDLSTFTHVTYVKAAQASGATTGIKNTTIAQARALYAKGDNVSSVERLRDSVRTWPIWQDGPRQRIREKSIVINETLGQPCVRADLIADDPKAPGAPPGVALVVEASAFYCVHPRDADIVVTVAYSRRTLPGETPTATKEEGKRFLESLEFSPVKR
jgi:hypothetical protein